ncbi:MAG TPA: hypothetical protein VFP35_00760 [Candidatus Saccharimonadales bacterium]|nr:hypothetical protein [Candidatus Saccharimonadales bacterium]
MIRQVEAGPRTFRPMGTGRRHIHEHGLKWTAAKSRPADIGPNEQWPDHERARRFFEVASKLQEAPNGHHPDHSLTIHTARIARDAGFALVRQAITAEKGARLAMLKQAWQELADSAQMTESLMPVEAEPLPVYTPEARAFLDSEHGATISCLGRTAVVAKVLDIQTKEPDIFFDEAQIYLATGSNRYYETSNAKQAARWSVISGQTDRAQSWLETARDSVKRALEENPVNYQAAQASLYEAEPYLANPVAARAAALARP